MVKLSLERFNNRYYISGGNSGHYYIVDKATGEVAYMLSGYVEGMDKIYPDRYGLLSNKNIFFTAGVVCSPLELFETLTDKEKEEAIWELDQWK